ncbi:MAG: F0F1 ATP synthase subunit gamma, partial [Congregibacter sp.]|nr:F0F1 ATP synthase subunit gamma [Congregibacter sp.]
SVVGHISNSAPEYRHVYMQDREIKRVGFIVVSTDRGLCGGLNMNVFKATIRAMKKWADQGIEIDLSLVGSKAIAFFNSYGGNVIAVARDIGEAPALEDLIGGVKTMLDAYEDGKIDRLFLVSNEFVNTMTQSPTVEQLLPLQAEDSDEMKHHWDYIYEPEARDLLEGLLTRYIESQVYQAVVENVACEQAARMLAMKNATDNAGDLIDELQLIYNKARQAAITQELSEIVSGAAAIS